MNDSLLTLLLASPPWRSREIAIWIDLAFRLYNLSNMATILQRAGTAASLFCTSTSKSEGSMKRWSRQLHFTPHLLPGADISRHSSSSSQERTSFVPKKARSSGNTLSVCLMILLRASVRRRDAPLFSGLWHKLTITVFIASRGEKVFVWLVDFTTTCKVLVVLWSLLLLPDGSPSQSGWRVSGRVVMGLDAACVGPIATFGSRVPSDKVGWCVVEILVWSRVVPWISAWADLYG